MTEEKCRDHLANLDRLIYYWWITTNWLDWILQSGLSEQTILLTKLIWMICLVWRDNTYLNDTSCLTYKWFVSYDVFVKIRLIDWICYRTYWDLSNIHNDAFQGTYCPIAYGDLPKLNTCTETVRTYIHLQGHRACELDNRFNSDILNKE